MGNRHNYSKHYNQDFAENKTAIETPEFEEIEETTQEEPKSMMGEVSVEKLNLRSTPYSETNDNIVTELNNGDPVEIIETIQNWHKICTATGAEGYVMSQYIKVHE